VPVVPLTDMPDALACPPGTLVTTPVTPLQLADFCRNPRTLYGKRLIRIALGPIDAEDKDSSDLKCRCYFSVVYLAKIKLKILDSMRIIFLSYHGCFFLNYFF
jgi:hypothetical protein